VGRETTRAQVNLKQADDTGRLVRMDFDRANEAKQMAQEKCQRKVDELTAKHQQLETEITNTNTELEVISKDANQAMKT